MSDLFLESVTITRRVRSGQYTVETEVYLQFTDQQPEIETGDIKRLVSESVQALSPQPTDK